LACLYSVCDTFWGVDENAYIPSAKAPGQTFGGQDHAHFADRPRGKTFGKPKTLPPLTPSQNRFAIAKFNLQDANIACYSPENGKTAGLNRDNSPK